MTYAFPKCTPLWSPELYTLGMLPMWAKCVLLLWWAEYLSDLVSDLVSMACPWVQLLPDPSLCRGYQPLVGGSESWGGRVQYPGGGEILGLVLTQWAELCLGVSGCRARVPKSSISLIVGITSSWHAWLNVLWCPKLVFAQWCMVLYPGLAGWDGQGDLELCWPADG